MLISTLSKTAFVLIAFLFVSLTAPCVSEWECTFTSLPSNYFDAETIFEDGWYGSFQVVVDKDTQIAAILVYVYI